jgi:hypothetical protein
VCFCLLSQEEKQRMEAEIDWLVAQQECSQLGDFVVQAVAHRKWWLLQQWMQESALYPTGGRRSQRRFLRWCFSSYEELERKSNG